ncbi:META domain-containing protein [Agromyces soli]
MFDSTAQGTTVTRRRRILEIVTAAATAALLLAGCAGSPGAAPTPTPELDEAAVAGIWVDESATPSPALMLAPDGTATGTDGCNRLTGTWQLDGDVVEFGAFAATRMFCEGVDDWLSGAASATVSGSEMTVLGAKGKKLGTLERTGDADAMAASAAFVGTWGINDASQPHLVITEDGRFSGGDGCNALVGSWELDDDGIGFESTATTLMACPGTTPQLGALDSATVDGDSLTVLDDAGNVIVVLPRTA